MFLRSWKSSWAANSKPGGHGQSRSKFTNVATAKFSVKNCHLAIKKICWRWKCYEKAYRRSWKNHTTSRGSICMLSGEMGQKCHSSQIAADSSIAISAHVFGRTIYYRLNQVVCMHGNLLDASCFNYAIVRKDNFDVRNILIVVTNSALEWCFPTSPVLLWKVVLAIS